MAKKAVPGMGYFAICLDTENNSFGIWETDPNAKQYLIEGYLSRHLKTLKISEYDNKHLSISKNFWDIFERSQINASELDFSWVIA